VAASNSPLHSDRTELSATKRILNAAARQVAAGGAAALSMSDIARDAGVSKALIHYHFAAKDTLLARLIEHLATGLTEREHAALAPYVHEHNPLAVDALWAWLEGELHRGDIRVLLELDAHRGPEVQAAARAAATLRLSSANETVRRLFGILDLRPRIEPSLLATVLLAFVNGLAMGFSAEAREESATPPRVAFDVFWLAMLSLAE
jgi:AcrR family transcriptional regulator